MSLVILRLLVRVRDGQVDSVLVLPARWLKVQLKSVALVTIVLFFRSCLKWFVFVEDYSTVMNLIHSVEKL